MGSCLINASPTETVRGGGSSPFSSLFKGMMIGVGAPGMAVGGLAGGVVGGLAAPLSDAHHERYWVGMVSTGLWVGGGVGMGIATGGIIQQLGQIMDPMVAGALVATLIMGYAAHVIGTTLDAVHTIPAPSSSDAVQHRWVMGQVSQQADPLSAMMIGGLKESTDFWFGTGHPEWRDWHANWLGITEGPTP